MIHELNSILNDIKSEEYALRDIIVTPTNIGNEISGKDARKSKQFAQVISFMILCQYNNVLDFNTVNNVTDIDLQLTNSQHRNSYHFTQLWNSIKNSYPYIVEFARILQRYDLYQYKMQNCDKSIAEFLINNFLFDDLDYWTAPNNLTYETCYQIINETKKVLGVELRNDGKYFISAENAEILKIYINEYIPTQEFIFSNCTYYTNDLKLLTLFLDYYSNWEITEEPLFNTSVEESLNNEFDGIIYMRIINKDIQNIEDLLPLITKGGFCIAFNQSSKRSYDSGNLFMYKIPLILDIHESLVIVCVKENDINKDVRCGQFFISEGYNEAEYWKDKFVRLIKLNNNEQCFQNLKKDDLLFAVNRNISYSSIKRNLDQMNFVWRRLSDVISQPETELIIDSNNLDIEPVIDYNDLSNNPFKIKAKASYYSHPLNPRKSESNEIYEAFKLKPELKFSHNYHYSYTIPAKYELIFKDAFNWNGNKNDDALKLKKLLTCQIVNTPALIYDSGRILRVEASDKNPVCIRKINFFDADDFGKYDCQGQVNVIKISPQYDENFIIYQLLNRNTLSDHILVAPTKEEQRTYFLNKRIEYISSIQPAMDEMEYEIQRALSQTNSRINGVGFKNFRRFNDLNMLPLGCINILVGGNNAGKSTLVKGLLLILDNLKTLNTQNVKLLGEKGMFNFQLDANNIHDVHVGTYNRALSHSAHTKKNETQIEFNLKIANYIIQLTISPHKFDDVSTVPIRKIQLIDTKRNITFIFDYQNGTTTICSNSLSSSNFNYICKGIPHDIFKYKVNVISAQIRTLVDYITSENDEHNEFDQLKELSNKIGFMIEIADEINDILSNIQIEYIYAHGIQQKILFNYNDRNDFMAMTLHDLMNEHISDEEHNFIVNTMKLFGIGKDFDISSIGGEAYTLQIMNQEGIMVHLADMGMGASQLLILIFKLATIIHRQRMRGITPYRPTIIIEEPEQNMHPEYQSKLADLFYEMHNKFGFNFIVETHSEYLVRKTQVIVSNEKYNEEDLKLKNPFKIFYFPNNDTPYEMEYRSDGNFINEFGKGFYDEASNLLFSIL